MQEVVWSVIVLLSIGLLFTLSCVAYILIIAYKEMQHGQAQEQEREVRQRETK